VVSNVPAGADVWITVHLDYKLKGTTQSSTFLKTPKTYGPFQSDIVVKDATGTTVMPGGTSSSSTTLIGRGKKVTMVYGTMTDPDGNAMENAWVRLAQGSTKALTKTDSNGFYVFFDGQQCLPADSLYGCTVGLSSLTFGSGSNVSTNLTVLGDGLTPPLTWETSSQILPTGKTSVTVSGSCSSPICTLGVSKGSAYQRNWKFS
jgi:hypothetical protein